MMALVVPSQLSSPAKTPLMKVPVNSIFWNGSRAAPVAENSIASLFWITVNFHVWVRGSIPNNVSESLKVIRMDAIEPSGFVAALSQSPVNMSREAKVSAVGVGGKNVGNTGVPVGEAQADSTQSNKRKVEKMRMCLNIIQRIQKIPLQ